MSYADLLSQYANKMNEVRGHAEEVSQSIAGTKAASAKELYDRAQEHLSLAGEASAAASGAWMAGRKLYKKFQGSKAGTKPSTADSESPPDGTSASSGDKSVGQNPEPSEEGATGAEEDDGGAQEVEDEAAQRGAIDQATKGEFPEPAKPPSGDLKTNVEAGEDEPAPEVSAQGPTLEGAPTEAVEATAGDTVSAANVGEQVGGNIAKSALKTVAKTAGEGLGETAGDAVGAGLASQALDFLGPVGLGIGAITGLVDLFEGVFGKKPKSAGEEATPIESEGGGLDTKGLTASDAPATATLV